MEVLLRRVGQDDVATFLDAEKTCDEFCAEVRETLGLDSQTADRWECVVDLVVLQGADLAMGIICAASEPVVEVRIMGKYIARERLITEYGETWLAEKRDVVALEADFDYEEDEESEEDEEDEELDGDEWRSTVFLRRKDPFALLARAEKDETRMRLVLQSELCSPEVIFRVCSREETGFMEDYIAAMNTLVAAGLDPNLQAPPRRTKGRRRKHKCSRPDPPNTQHVLVKLMEGRAYDAAIALLHRGANANATYPNGLTALMCAVQCRHMELVKLLLAKGAEVDYMTREGQTAMFFVLMRPNQMFGAYWGGMFDEEEEEEELEEEEEEEEDAPLPALDEPTAAIIDELLRQGAAIDGPYDPPLHDGAVRETPLLRAAARGQGAHVRAFLSRGASTAHVIHGIYASRDGRPRCTIPILNALLAGGADVNYVLPRPDNVIPRLKNCTTPLTAICAGDLSPPAAAALRWLLRNGADVELRAGSGRTPLSLACKPTRVRFVELLLAHGADPNTATVVKGRREVMVKKMLDAAREKYAEGKAGGRVMLDALVAAADPVDCDGLHTLRA